MIYLDTHVVVWLYAGLIKQFRPTAVTLINQHDLVVSPIVRLELQYLFEIGRISSDAHTIAADLTQRVGLTICAKPFDTVVTSSLSVTWTRDPFDRLIVAQAAVQNDLLLSKDQKILTNYGQARW